MAIYNLKDLRSALGSGADALSDEVLLDSLSKATGQKTSDLANQLRYDGGSSSMNRERMSSSVDSYQANLYDAGRAATGALGLQGASEWMDKQRNRNQIQSDVASQRAADKGAISSFSDVGGFGDFGNYAAGLAIGSLPYLGEAAVGGVITRGLSTGLRAAGTLGRATGATAEVVQAGNAAQKALAGRAAIGGAVASYPSAVGDILSNQRDQMREQGIEGSTNDFAAAAGGVPYAALNMLDPLNNAVTRGQLFRSGAKSLDSVQGARGLAARTAVTAGKVGTSEGLNEMGQEVINQGFGRMAVDPNESLTSEGAMGRYGEAFIGGAVLGGAAGSVGGGWRRSEGYMKPQDLLTPDAPEAEPLRLGLNSTMTGFPSGTVARSNLSPDDEMRARYGEQYKGQQYGTMPEAGQVYPHDAELGTELGLSPQDIASIRANNYGAEDEQGMLRFDREVVDNLLNADMAYGDSMAPLVPPPSPHEPLRLEHNKTMIGFPGGTATRAGMTSDEELQARYAPQAGSTLAQTGAQNAQNEQENATAASIQQNAAQKKAQVERFSKYTNLKPGTASLKVFGELELLLNAGHIDKDEFEDAAGTIAANQLGSARKEVKAFQARAASVAELAGQAPYADSRKSAQGAVLVAPTLPPPGPGTAITMAPTAEAGGVAATAALPAVVSRVSGPQGQRTYTLPTKPGTAITASSVPDKVQQIVEELVNAGHANDALLRMMGNRIGHRLTDIEQFAVSKVADKYRAERNNGATVKAGRSGREKEYNRGEMEELIRSLPPEVMDIIHVAAGTDAEGNGTGMVLPFSHVAAIISKRTGVPISAKTVEHTLNKAGINAKVLLAFSQQSVEAVSAESAFGPTAEGDTPSYRVTDTAAGVNEPGIIDDKKTVIADNKTDAWITKATGVETGGRAGGAASRLESSMLDAETPAVSKKEAALLEQPNRQQQERNMGLLDAADIDPDTTQKEAAEFLTENADGTPIRGEQARSLQAAQLEWNSKVTEGGVEWAELGAVDQADFADVYLQLKEKLITNDEYHDQLEAFQAGAEKTSKLVRLANKSNRAGNGPRVALGTGSGAGRTTTTPRLEGPTQTGALDAADGNLASVQRGAGGVPGQQEVVGGRRQGENASGAPASSASLAAGLRENARRTGTADDVAINGVGGQVAFISFDEALTAALALPNDGKTRNGPAKYETQLNLTSRDSMRVAKAVAAGTVPKASVAAVATEQAVPEPVAPAPEVEEAPAAPPDWKAKAAERAATAAAKRASRPYPSNVSGTASARLGTSSTAKAGPGFDAGSLPKAPAPAPAPVAKAVAPAPTYPSNVSGTASARLGTSSTAKAGPGFDAGSLPKAPAQVALESQSAETALAAITPAEQAQVAAFYGPTLPRAEIAKRFLADVLKSITHGLSAVAKAIRAIVEKAAKAILVSAAVLNPTAISGAHSYIVSQPMAEVKARVTVPASVARNMSPAAKEAYVALFSGLQGKLAATDKLMFIVDKPTARVFVFKPDGTVLFQKKVLLGEALGDDYVGGTEGNRQNRITPAGLFKVALEPNADYDTGKVLATVAENGDYSVTIMHSVYKHAANSSARIGALKNDTVADSRYSFGCVNVDQQTYANLIATHAAQMDGAHLFIVPDNQERVKEFLHAANNGDELTRGTVPVLRQKSGVEAPLTDIEKQQKQYADANNNLVPDALTKKVTRDRMEELSSFVEAMERLDDLGIAHIANSVSEWRVATMSNRFMSQGWVEHKPDGRQILTIRLGKDVRHSSVRFTVAHELGHIVDSAGAGGVYSAHAALRVRLNDQGKIVPIGRVAQEFASLQTAPDVHEDWAKILEYPFDTDAHKMESTQEAESEIFAQMFAAYNSPELHKAMQSQAPLTYQFMKEVVDDIRTTQASKIHGTATAARRAAAFARRPAFNNQNTGLGNGESGQSNSRVGSESGGSTVRRQAGGNPGVNPKAVRPLDDIPTPTRTNGGILGAIDGVLKDGLWRTFPSLLGFLSGDQLAQRFTSLPGVKAFADLSSRMSSRANHVMLASDVVNRRWDALRSANKGASDTLSKLLLQATTHGMWPGKDFNDAAHNHIKDSPANQATHAALAKTWQSMPAEARALFDAVIGDHKARFDAKVAAMRNAVVETYYPEADGKGALTKAEVDQIAAHQTSGERAAIVTKLSTDKRRAKAANQLSADLDTHADNFKGRPGPYFPLSRFGDHIVVAKSSAFTANEAELKAAQEHLGELEQDSEDKDALKAARDDVKRLVAVMQGYKRSGKDYRVEMFENQGDARVYEEKLRAAVGDDVLVYRSIKDQYLREVDAVSPTFMRRIEGRLGKFFEGENKDEIRQAMRDLYLQMLPDSSAMKSEMNRATVEGYSQDAMRAFAASAMRDSHAISRLEYQGRLRDAMDELRFDRQNLDSKILGQELAKRLQLNFKQVTNPLIAKMTNATYLTYLGMSPSFMVTQVAQPWTTSVPIIAARHHFKSIGAMKRGIVDAVSMVLSDRSKQGTWRTSLDLDRALKAGNITADEKVLLQQMLDNGRIDITVQHDLGASASGDSERNWLSKAAETAGLFPHTAEVINRVGTALAAFRLEKEAQLAKNITGPAALEAARAYADKIVHDTHLNYAGENKARFMHNNTWGGWGRVMFQFRGFQQGMIYLISKNLLDAHRGDKEARRAVAYLSGTMLAVAGTTGLPAAGAVAFVIQKMYQAFTDDDDEQDLGQKFYAGLESSIGTTAANALVKGLPAAVGIDASGRLGLGEIASPVRVFGNPKAGKDTMNAYAIAGMGGASFGMLGNWADAAVAAGQGDAVKAAQKILPKVLSDLIRAGKESTGGVTDSKGRVLVTPEERDVIDTLTRAVGFATTGDARMQERRGAFYEAKGNRDNARRQLLTQFSEARLSGADVGDTVEKMAQFNERHPDVRITGANRESAVKHARDAQKQMRGGVPVGKRDQALAVEVGV